MKYDVIVIGAGAAGAPLAARLSDDPARSVLLVEAGRDFARNEDFPADLLDAAGFAGAMPGHPQNWAFAASLTPELQYTVARGKVLGGSTTINGTYYIRGRKADFDRWAALGNTEWSYEKVLPFFRAQECDLDYGESDIHGGSGPVPIRRPLTGLHPVTMAFAEACAELGYPGEADKNAEGLPGYGPLPVNAVDGVRINTGMAFVNPRRDRPNLTIVGDSYARCVIFAGTRACGIEVDRGGQIHAIAAEEIVLACGAIKSPHLLALSGVGPAEELRAAGIPVVVDLPGVGKRFSDHPDLSVHWVANRSMFPDEHHDVFESVLNFTASGSDYVGDLQIMPMLKSLRPVLGVFARAGLTEPIKRSLHTLQALRGVPMRRLRQRLLHRHDQALGVALQQSDARGAITTLSRDPHVAPRIEYHYLDNESDCRRMREVVRVAVSVLRTDAMSPYVKRLTELDDRTASDDVRLDAWIRAHLSTAIHTSGSCSMGADPEDGAVVDQHGRVHGVTGLRIADSSILPGAPSRGPAATTIMIGLRMAELMSRTDAPAPGPQ